MTGPRPGPLRILDADGPPADGGDSLALQVRATCRYLLAQGCGIAEAEDLTQDAFAIAWSKGAEGMPPGRRAAFLRTTALNLLRNRRRQRHGREVSLQDAVHVLFEEACAADSGEALWEAVARCKEQLAPKARTALELVYEQGCGREQVATRLDLKANGLKTLLQRTRDALRHCVERSLR